MSVHILLWREILPVYLALGCCGDNPGGHAFLGKISRYRNHFVLHQPKVQVLDPSLSHTPWLWQKRLHRGPGNDCGVLVQGVRGGRWQDGVRVEGESVRICRSSGFGVDKKISEK